MVSYNLLQLVFQGNTLFLHTLRKRMLQLTQTRLSRMIVLSGIAESSLSGMQAGCRSLFFAAFGSVFDATVF